MHIVDDVWEKLCGEGPDKSFDAIAGARGPALARLRLGYGLAIVRPWPRHHLVQKETMFKESHFWKLYNIGMGLSVVANMLHSN